MNTCDACKFWGPFESARDGEAGIPVGSCSSKKFHHGYDVGLADIQPDGAVVENDEGWAMHTAPKFGCIHWHPAQVSDE